MPSRSAGKIARRLSKEPGWSERDGADGMNRRKAFNCRNVCLDNFLKCSSEAGGHNNISANRAFLSPVEANVLQDRIVGI